MYKSICVSWLLAATPALASTDPIAADPSTGAHFNRYAYANNNPYKYVDPDGRAARIVHHANGIRVELPTRFSGPGASQENIDRIRRGFEGQSGVYNVDGKPTRVDFRITESTYRTPWRLRNRVHLFLGPTDDAGGVSYAYMGGTKAGIDVLDADFPNGVGEHELNHLAGGDDAYLINALGEKASNPARSGDIMNEVPGVMTDTVINEILQHPHNRHVKE
jgi:hypothetical protein